uniref:C2H2-type domain-containing protein n=1 Tax=Acrobeloides nanus TaxID=290746 RepID=A0A914D069_9BILA
MNVHNDSRPFACEFCNYAAASQMTLRRHILRNHTPRSMWGYQCPHCTEKFMEPASYQHHVLTRHFGRSATFGCPSRGCNFTTKSSKHFTDHFLKHAANTNLKPSSVNFSAFLVDDEIGIGYSKIPMRKIIRRPGEVPNSRSLVKRAEILESNKLQVGTSMAPKKLFVVRNAVSANTSISQVSNSNVPEPVAKSNKDDDFGLSDYYTEKNGYVQDLDELNRISFKREADWIEEEVEISDNSAKDILLPDGQTRMNDLDLD